MVYHAVRCPNKRAHNRAFARATASWLGASRICPAEALILDDSTWKTTSALVESAADLVGNITVPQHDPEEHDAMAQARPYKRVRLLQSSLGDCVPDKRKHPFDAVYLDYCCTLKGTARDVRAKRPVRPQRDLKNLLLNAAKSRIVLAASFCTRGTTAARTRKRFERILRECGWEWERQREQGARPMKEYKKTMAFGLYLLKPARRLWPMPVARKF